MGCCINFRNIDQLTLNFSFDSILLFKQNEEVHSFSGNIISNNKYYYYQQKKDKMFTTVYNMENPQHHVCPLLMPYKHLIYLE